MRSLGGFVLLAGVGVGLFVYFPAPVDRNTTLEEAKRALAERAADAQVRVASATSSAPSRLASFSPVVKLNAPQASTAAGQPFAQAARVETIANWQSAVTSTSGTLEPTDPDSRYKLVVDIQQQLKRVGCYWGRVNGAWNANTREAMRQFTTQSNAALPVDKPDFMLLSLLKGHSGRSCGAPGATVATTTAPETLPWKAPSASPTQAARLYTPVASSAVSNEPLPGRMSIGGPSELSTATREPLVPGNTQPAGVATAALDADASAPVGSGYSAPAAAPKPRPSKKTSSGSHRRPKVGTPRYNLMLSLGGVY